MSEFDLLKAEVTKVRNVGEAVMKLVEGLFKHFEVEAEGSEVQSLAKAVLENTPISPSGGPTPMNPPPASYGDGTVSGATPVQGTMPAVELPPAGDGPSVQGTT